MGIIKTAFLPSYEILLGDAREVLRGLDEGIAQTCITSPPYFGLRDYGTGEWSGGDPDCDHFIPQGPQDRDMDFNARYGRSSGARAQERARRQQYRSTCERCGAERQDQQIGLEDSVDDYVASIVEVMRGVWHVLADDGTLWLNLGDSYNAYNGNRGASKTTFDAKRGQKDPTLPAGYGLTEKSLKNKDLIGVPWRVAFALQADGWYLRSDVIWRKPNPMPSSIKDRLTSSHEYLFMLTKKLRYRFNFEAIMEPRADLRETDGAKNGRQRDRGGRTDGFTKPNGIMLGELRRKRDVWDIPEDLFKQFLRWLQEQNIAPDVWSISQSNSSAKGIHLATFPPKLVEPCILAGSDPGGLVLDPFAGAGTTCVVAREHWRRFLGIELKERYRQLAIERIEASSG